jgi:hypothetical protein
MSRASYLCINSTVQVQAVRCSLGLIRFPEGRTEEMMGEWLMLRPRRHEIRSP